MAEVYFESCQIFKMELFRTFWKFQLSTIFVKNSIVDVEQGSEYASQFPLVKSGRPEK